MSFQNMLTQILNFFVELHAPSGFETSSSPHTYERQNCHLSQGSLARLCRK